MTILGRPRKQERGPADDDTAGMAASTNPERSIPFAILAAVCGFALIVMPFMTEELAVGLQPYRWPIIVVGLAAIAAALGSQAVAK